jgi:chromate transporter
VVTIGGAYAGLAYAAQDAVGRLWLAEPRRHAGRPRPRRNHARPADPGAQFIGFLAGFRAPGAVSGVAGGILGSLLTLWCTFAPCFMFVFLGAPVIDRLQSNTSLAGALAAITAAVVGVIGNLAAWFALQVLFRAHAPSQARPDRARPARNQQASTPPPSASPCSPASASSN